MEFPNFERVGVIRDGHSNVVVEADERTIPLFLREGGMSALTEPAFYTTTANWRTLTWHLYAGPTIRGSLYEDAGDGYGESRETSIAGCLRDGVLRLHRAVKGNRAFERTKRSSCTACPA